MIKKKFKIEGMGSEHCAGVVKNAVEKLNGVAKIETNFNDGFAIVEYQSESIGVSDIEKAIDDAGYKATAEE